MHNRREVRELVMKGLYALELSGLSTSHVLKHVIKPSIADDSAALRFGEKLLQATLDHQEDLDAEIGKYLDNWDLNRLAVIDRIVLRMAVAEFMHFDDIPTKVTINEAIEIAKIYSTGNSGKFVNGILDAVLQKLREENRIVKKGRGLIDSSVY